MNASSIDIMINVNVVTQCEMETKLWLKQLFQTVIFLWTVATLSDANSIQLKHFSLT